MLNKYGIDISRWQGDFDLKKAKQKYKVEFVIIKGAGNDNGTLYVDSQFITNYNKAKECNLPIGVYLYSQATTKAEMKKEVDYFYNECIKGRQFELPIYIDIEDSKQMRLTKEQLTDIVEYGCRLLEKYNLFVGVYASGNTFRHKLNNNRMEQFTLWVAQWTSNYTYIDINCDMWQFGGDCNERKDKYINGIVVDQNYLFKDFKKIITNGGFNGYKPPQTQPQEQQQGDILSNVICAGDVVGVKKGSKDLNTKGYYAEWVYNFNNFEVIEVNVNNVVFGVKGSVTGKTAKENIIK